MPIKLNSAGGGSVTLTPASTASAYTITVPANTGNLVTDTSGSTVQFGIGSAAAPSVTNISDTASGVFFPTTSTVAISTGGSERLRVNSSGNVAIGTTSADPIGGNVTGVLLINNGQSQFSADGLDAVKVNRKTSTGALMTFFYNGPSTVGTISTNGTQTAYNTTSDYRLKENVQPMQNAMSKVSLLNPVTYTWKADGSDGQGFIAHELQAVMPDCVTGEKDAVDADGNPVYQGIDVSFLVATLTKAIQEIKIELDAANARIAVLEAQ